MTGRIPDETLQAIRERVSLVEVVSGYVTLRKAGRNHLGLCPFHSEKTPSFTVNDERGLFHCFGCGAGGTVFTFVMRIDRIDFRDAVELLAHRAGIALPARGDTGPGGEQRQQLIELNRAAQRHFEEALRAPGGTPGRQYLEKRGLRRTTVEQYGIGYCPPTGGTLARALAGKKLPIQKAVELGLVGRRADGSMYDRFWGRVTFPIRDGSGNILGFGGRTLGSDHPKYLNSPESPLFHKGQVLYGLFEARDAIRSAERVVVVEGYLDALALVEAGIGYAVASLGTALTPAQLRLAKRFAPEVVAFFDGDRAGQQAAARAFGACVEAGVWGLGAFLPEGFDPDTYVRAHGADATRAILQRAIPLADFFLQRMSPGADATLPQRARAAEEVGRVITKVHDPIQFNLLAKQAAEHLRVDEAIFRDVRARGVAAGPSRPPAPPHRPDQRFRAEEATLLEVMAWDHDVARLVSRSGVLDAFSDAALADAGRAVLAAWENDNNGTSALDKMPGPIAERISAAVLGEGAVSTDDRLHVAQDCIDAIERRQHRSQVREGVARLRLAEARGDDAAVREQLQRNSALLRRREV